MSFGLQLTYQGPAHHCGEGPEAHGFNATKELTWPCIRICYCFFKFTEYLFRNIGKKEKLQDIHNSNEADRFILALFMSHVLI
jgi:hypothetical protein